MSIARSLTRSAITAAITLNLLVMPQAALAAPAPGLCHMDTARGTVPTSFAIDACVEKSGIWLHNNLDVPIGISKFGSAETPITLTPNQSIAAVVTRARMNDPNLLLPGDIMKIPLGDKAATIGLDNTKAAPFYLWAVTQSAFLPANKTKDVLDAFTGMISDMSEASLAYADCIDSPEWIARMGCQVTYMGDLTIAFGKGLAVGMARAGLALALSVKLWADVIAAQVPNVASIIHGERSIRVASYNGPSGVSLADLLKAPVPPLCQHAAGHLENGVFKGLDPSQGFEFLSAPSVDPGEGLALGDEATAPVFADLNHDGETDGAAIISCSAGGVSWPDNLLIYGPGPQLIGSADLTRDKTEHADVKSLQWTDNQLKVDWVSYNGCCFFATHRSATVNVTAKSVTTGPYANVGAPGCPSSQFLADAWDRLYPDTTSTDVIGPRCIDGWGVAEVDNLDGNAETGVFRFERGQWRAVDQATPCRLHLVPPEIYAEACNTN